jgi:signal transduction histidine kinase
MGLDPAATRRVIDAAAYLLAFATFMHFGDTEILLHAMWVTIGIGAFVYGLRTALLRILVAAIVAILYSSASMSVGLPAEIEPLDFAEWPLMVVISVIVAAMADMLSTSAKRYAALYRQASDRLHSAHEEERARLARDLHDGVGQTLTAVVLNLDAAEAALRAPSDAPAPLVGSSIRRAQVLAAAALDEVRDVAAQLRPARIREIGLGAAIANLADAAGVRVQVRFDPRELPAGLLGAEGEIEAYRIVQEALGNAARHGRARSIWIDGGVVDGQMRIEIGDSGVGFDAAASARGLGLDGMAERAAILNGRLEIRSLRGAGTTVALVVPLPDRPVEPAPDPQPVVRLVG